MSEDLVRLAELLGARDELDAQIAEVVGRSARPGDVGEFIAARIFDIDLAASSTQAGYDGVFRSGPFRGKTVNVKTYGDVLAGIDIGAHPCDCYLILTGPPRGGSVGVRHHPWRITGVYMFEMAKLVAVLQQRGVKIEIATSLRKADVEAARIFPENDRSPLPLSPDQVAVLQLFSGRVANDRRAMVERGLVRPALGRGNDPLVGVHRRLAIVIAARVVPVGLPADATA